MSTFEVNCCVRVYHVYHRLWTATVGENLTCTREPTNESDRYAVAITKDRSIIGHVPRKMSHACSMFLQRRGSITCPITGTRRYSVDLAQGGMEIPCKLFFTAKPKDINKLRKLLK